MKKTLLAIAVMIFTTFATFGQSDVYMSAYFNGTTYPSDINTNNYTNLSDTNLTHTFEMWIKLDTLTEMYMLHAPVNITSGTGINTYVGLNIQNDTTIRFVYRNNVGTPYKFTYDTNWHHIAFVTDTIGSYDTCTLFYDGVAVKGMKNTHTTVSPVGSYNKIGICSHIPSSAGHDVFFHGNMSRFLISDTVLYNSTFVPDCVYDSIANWDDTTIAAPYEVYIPFNNNTNMYFSNITPAAFKIQHAYYTFTLGTSPCAPLYSFMIPPTGTDSVIVVARQTNMSYGKGAHMSVHHNGWDTTISTSITYGAYDDSMTVYTTGTYDYYDDYKNLVSINDTLVTITTTSVKDVYNVNDIKVYPNPSTGDFNVAVTNPVLLVIYDMTGHVVYNTNITDKTTIHLSQGMYICTTTNATTNVVRSTKILIQ